MTNLDDLDPVAVERADAWMRHAAPGSRRLAIEDPRLAAVLGGAMVEDQLRLAINVRRAKGSDETSQYASISAVRATAFQFGLILDRHNSEIKLITQIRNRFAHSWDLKLDFESPSITQLVSELQAPNLYDEAHPQRTNAIYADMGRKRGRWFISTCAILTGLRYVIECSDPIDPIPYLPARVVFSADWFTTG